MPPLPPMKIGTAKGPYPRPIITDINLETIAFTDETVDRKRNYQSFETIGDTVVNTCASQLIMGLHPSITPNEITLIKSTLVSNQNLCRYAKLYNFDKEIRSKRPISDKMQADVFEAFCYAVVKSNGLDYRPIVNWFSHIMHDDLRNLFQKHVVETRIQRARTAEEKETAKAFELQFCFSEIDANLVAVPYNSDDEADKDNDKFGLTELGLNPSAIGFTDRNGGAQSKDDKHIKAFQNLPLKTQMVILCQNRGHQEEVKTSFYSGNIKGYPWVTYIRVGEDNFGPGRSHDQKRSVERARRIAIKEMLKQQDDSQPALPSGGAAGPSYRSYNEKGKQRFQGSPGRSRFQQRGDTYRPLYTSRGSGGSLYRPVRPNSPVRHSSPGVVEISAGAFARNQIEQKRKQKREARSKTPIPISDDNQEDEGQQGGKLAHLTGPKTTTKSSGPAFSGNLTRPVEKSAPTTSSPAVTPQNFSLLNPSPRNRLQTPAAASYDKSLASFGSTGLQQQSSQGGVSTGSGSPFARIGSSRQPYFSAQSSTSTFARPTGILTPLASPHRNTLPQQSISNPFSRPAVFQNPGQPAPESPFKRMPPAGPATMTNQPTAIFGRSGGNGRPFTFVGPQGGAGGGGPSPTLQRPTNPFTSYRAKDSSKGGDTDESGRVKVYIE